MRDARILVIDDFQDAQTTLVAVLESAGRIAIACNSADAVTMLLGFRPDVALVDVDVGTSQLIAQLRPLTSAVFIGMVRSVACPEGLAGTLHKPFGLTELLSAIDVALDPEILQ